MNRLDNSSDHTKSQHGTIGSYVIGFLLSLTLTMVAYYLVVNHKIAGTALLVTILGLGFVQAIIQITFFLHLGRGPKPNWNLFFFVATIGVVLIVVGGSIMIIHNLHYNMSPSDQSKKLVDDEGIAQVGGRQTGACEGQHINHQVIIFNNTAVPLHSTATKCDTLTFINKDNVVRQIAFGPHPQHQVYAGITELTLRRHDRGETMTLSESGMYPFHDHLNPGVNGDFAVNP